MDIPYFAIGNDELAKIKETVKKGDVIIHTHLDGREEEAIIQYGKNDKDEEVPLLGFYTLANGRAYLASVAGKLMQRPTLRKKVTSQ
jgi:hypothetical protein